ncbi:MAG TPA: DNA polymerase I [Candidatus Baltobacteraceae bacterium]|nr:DNA polymerase I [Candidatus Baltobacteraceae bacterium]
MKNRFVIIDGNAILHRAWHAMPPLSTKDGRVISAAYGFTTMLMKVLKDLKPTHFAVTFDLPGGTFRHDEFAAYKAHRVEQPDELYAQIPMVKEVLAGYRIPVYEMPGFEADDVIGTLTMLAPKDAETIVVTGDMDTLQLVDKKTKVYSQRKGMSDIVVYDEAAVMERFGLKPSQMIDYKAMRGDTSDNLPGLKGIGEVNATALLKKYGSIEKMYEAVKKSPNDFKPGILKALIDGEKDVPLSKRLVTIVRDLPLKFKFEDARLRAPDLDKLREVFQDLEFRTLLPKVEKEYGEKPPRSVIPAKAGNQARTGAKSSKKDKAAESSRYETFEGESGAKEFAVRFKDAKRLSVRFGYLGDDRIDPKWSGAAAYDGENAAVWKSKDAKLAAPILKLLANDAVKIGHDLKNDLIALMSVGAGFGGALDDAMLTSYLLNPGSRAHGLSDLVFEATGRVKDAQASLFGEDVSSLADEAVQVWGLAEKMRAKLVEEGILKVYETIERPLLPVLAAMEAHGVKIDDVFLKNMETRMRTRIEQVTKSIVKAAGGDFNINSPAQLQEILFVKLGLPTKGIKKTSTGQLSTGADELEKLRGAHPIIADIFEHREYSKLLSTYVAAIPARIHPKTKRLHTRYNQAVAATGRLSSSDPNLQNIPIRTELGREIRKAFIADKGNLLIAADYSQFELRIAASISEDPKMTEAFRNGADIHTATAAEIWGITTAEVTFEQRRAAKAINFGILYGMGANALAASAGLSREEASDFIKRYLDAFKGLRGYMEQSKAQARSLGYVETLFGRRRYLPDINSGVPYLKAEAERMAINMPIQGTQADIIKLAMVRLHEKISKEYGLGPDADVKMLLQVHDELVFEVKESLAKDAAVWIKDIMEKTVSLKVPIDVQPKIGKTWGSLESLGK